MGNGAMLGTAAHCIVVAGRVLHDHAAVRMFLRCQVHRGRVRHAGRQQANGGTHETGSFDATDTGLPHVVNRPD